MSSTADCRWYCIRTHLQDGYDITIRAITPEDKKLLTDGFSRLSKKSVKFRFFGLKNELTNEELVYLTEIDHEKHVALVATIGRAESEQIVGVGRFIESDTSAPIRTAEVALAVVDEHQNRGIGSLLFEKLKEIALLKGITRFEAYVLSDNCRMCEIFRHHGTHYISTREADVTRITCDI